MTFYANGLICEVGDRVMRADASPERSIPAYLAMRGTVVAVDSPEVATARRAAPVTELGVGAWVQWDCDRGLGASWMQRDWIALVCPHCDQRRGGNDECGGEGEGVCADYARELDAKREPGEPPVEFFVEVKS